MLSLLTLEGKKCSEVLDKFFTIPSLNDQRFSTNAILAFLDNWTGPFGPCVIRNYGCPNCAKCATHLYDCAVRATTFITVFL